jgi:hypothetical protein
MVPATPVRMLLSSPTMSGSARKKATLISLFKERPSHNRFIHFVFMLLLCLIRELYLLVDIEGRFLSKLLQKERAKV